jgi:hypothetical protein
VASNSWDSGLWDTALWDALDGVVLASEAKDTAAINGAVRWQATLAASEARDTALVSGVITSGPEVAGSLNLLEAADTVGISATVSGVVAALGAVEASDILTVVAAARWPAALSATDAPDTASFNGAVRWSAALGAFEAPDTALINGTSRHLVTFAAGEAPDTALVQGSVFTIGEIAGSLVGLEAPDSVDISGDISGTVGTLTVIEAPDAITITGAVITAGTISGVVTAAETPDTARILGEVDLPEAPVDIVGPMQFGRKQRYLLGPWQVPVRW